MVIRRATGAEDETLLEIHASAFRHAEGLEPPAVALFAALDRAGDVLPALSLAADVDGVTVGHVVGSRAKVGPYAVAAVGPIGVLPRYEGRGIGTAMMRALLEADERLELPLVGLLGRPPTTRGSGSARDEPRDRAARPRWADEFQVRALPAFHPAVADRFAYAPAFDAVGA